MKKRILALLLAVMLVLLLLPSAALANVTLYSCNFEADPFQNGWTSIDNDQDDHDWNNGYQLMVARGFDTHGGSCCALSESYNNNIGAFDSDNWMFSPAISIPAASVQISWWADSQDSNWPDSYAVWVCTEIPQAVPFDPATMTTTMTKIYPESEETAKAPGDWALFTASLPDGYTGKNVYIAFQHQCSDCYMLKIDDFMVEAVGSVITNATPETEKTTNHGYIEIDKEVAAEGEKVTVTIYPDDGYRLRSLTVTDANGKRTWVTGNSFTMPAKAVTVTAEFEEIPADTYRVKVDESTDGGLMANTDRAEAGEIVRITVTPDKGFALETLSVRDRKGNEIEIRDMGNGWFTFVMPKSDVTVYGSFMEDNEMLNFCVDVKASDYYYDAVLWAYEQGVAKGIDSTHFGPNRVVTRAEAVTFLWRAAGCPAPTGDASQFTDVKKGSYYAKAVAWGIEKGVVKGTSKTTFSPHMLCSRAHIVSFLARFAGVEDAETVTRFTDVQPSDYFSAAVKWAEDNGVTEGTTSTTFSPHKNCTRAEVVTFLYRYMGK